MPLTIMGDPYFPTDSGTGNYNPRRVCSLLQITQDGTRITQNGLVDIIINFKIHRYLHEFGARGLKNETVKQFSGLYSVYEVTTLETINPKNFCAIEDKIKIRMSLYSTNKKKLLEVKNPTKKDR